MALKRAHNFAQHHHPGHTCVTRRRTSSRRRRRPGAAGFHRARHQPYNLMAPEAPEQDHRISLHAAAMARARDHHLCRYILGFPADTESILRDVEIIKKELPVDILEFFFLTPLPGSEDPRDVEAGVWMDADLNSINNRVTHHPDVGCRMGEAYHAAWESWFDPAISRRCCASAARKPNNRKKLVGSCASERVSSAVHGRGRASARGWHVSHEGPARSSAGHADQTPPLVVSQACRRNLRKLWSMARRSIATGASIAAC